MDSALTDEGRILDYLERSPLRMRHVRWFNTWNCIRDMSIAEHTSDMSNIALLLTVWLEYKGNRVNSTLVLSRCLLHDVEETITNDLPLPLKRENKELAEVWAKAKNFVMAKAVAILPESIGAWVLETWQHSKADGIEGEIVKAADLLSMVMYANEEIEMGNVRMREVRCRGIDLLAALNYQWLDPFVHELRTKWQK